MTNIPLSVRKALASNKLTRAGCRRFFRWIRTIVSASDAYADIFKFIRLNNIKHYLGVGAFRGETIEVFRDELSIEMYGVEPTPESFKQLKKKFAGDKHVHLFNLALSDKPETTVFHMNANAQSNSLLQNDEECEIIQEHLCAVDTVEVQCETLDNWMTQHVKKDPVFIKADVQGAENLLIDGGKQAFSENVIGFYSEISLVPMYKDQAMFTEFHQRLCNDFGFKMVASYPVFQDENGFCHSSGCILGTPRKGKITLKAWIATERFIVITFDMKYTIEINEF